MFSLLNGTREWESERDEMREMLWNGDNVKLSTETWYYMSDVLNPLEQYLEAHPEEKLKEKSLSDKGLQCSHCNPLYRVKGWTLDQLTDSYVKYGFFDLDHHFALFQMHSGNAMESKDIPRTER